MAVQLGKNAEAAAGLLMMVDGNECKPEGQTL